MQKCKAPIINFLYKNKIKLSKAFKMVGMGGGTLGYTVHYQRKSC